jgi:Zn-dependent protease with chaperone function
MWHDMQRAEYLADFLAARVSGTEAIVTVLRKAHSTTTFHMVSRELATGDSSQGLGLVARMRQAIGDLSSREARAAEQLQALHAARLNATHPPTANRILFLTARPVTHSALQLSDAEAAQLEQELLTMEAKIQDRLVDEYRSQLYRW